MPLLALVVVIAACAAVAGALLTRRVTALRRHADVDVVDQLRAELAQQRQLLQDQGTATVHEAVRSFVAIAREQLAAESSAGQDRIDDRDQALGQRLEAMGVQLERMRSLVTELDNQRAEGFGELSERLAQTGRVTGELSRTTAALREALASPQARGQWGERMAEDVLRAAGFTRGVNYHVQAASGTGRPDFTFPLPAGRCVHMDVKFPLDNYVRHLEATTDADARSARTAFLRDVRNRISEVARRDYVDPASGTLDQVLLFLPNEHVYGFLHQSDPGLIDHALAHKVVLCSPLTLFAVLAVIRQSVDDHLTEQRSAEILQLLAGFGDQWERFTEHLEKVGSRLESTRRAFDEVNGVRRRMLERHIDRIDDLRTAAVDQPDQARSVDHPGAVVPLREAADTSRDDLDAATG